MLASNKLSLFISIDAATAASTRNKRSGSESGGDSESGGFLKYKIFVKIVLSNAKYVRFYAP